MIICGGCAGNSILNKVEYASFAQLLADPKAYDGKRISVAGFYHGEFESFAVYDCREHANFGIMESGIWVDFPDRKEKAGRIQEVNDCYVRVEGIFHYTPKGAGHLGGWASEITAITLFARLPER